jgi:1-acyl-sn-glycerol-3-phosphate acyltransferase
MSYPFTRIFLGPIIKLYIRGVEGIENLPKGSPFIIASNHASYVDDFIMPYSIMSKANRKFHIFVNSRFYRNILFKKFLDHYKCIPVDVSKDVKDEKKRKKTNERAFKIALNGLNKGRVFLIFPEGSRSEDGKLKHAKTGVAKIALLSRKPVLPVGIRGSYDIMPKGAKFPKFKRADIIIGKPLYFDSFYGKEKDYKTLELVTRKIMREIAKLISQEYNY